MKILLVITKGEIGGAQEFVLSLAKGLKNKNVDVVVASGEGDYLINKLSQFGVKHYYLKSLKRSANPIFALSYILELRKLIKNEDFTHIHFNSSNTLIGVLSAKFLNRSIKTVFTVHGLSILDKNYQSSKFKKSLFKVYFKIFLNLIGQVVYVSEHNKKEALEQGISKKGIVIYNGLDIKDNYFIDPQLAKNKLSYFTNKDLNNKFLIGSIGRLAYPKNYEFLISLWPEIKKVKKQAKLLILGEGSERVKYEKLIKEMGLESDIFLPGELEMASQYLKAFDMFVLPSRYEGLSISLIEALFANIPILASDVGGNREVIGADNCFKFNDKQDFLDKLKKITTRPQFKSEFSLDKMVVSYLRVYKS